VFSASSVRHIAMDTLTGWGRSLKTRGYMNIISFGVLSGSSDDEKPAPFSAKIEHTYIVRPFFAAGIYTGYEQLNENTLPVGATIKFMLPLKSSNLFTGILGGYSLPLSEPDIAGILYAKGGFMYQMEAGYIIPVSTGTGIIIAAGYRYNELNYKVSTYSLGVHERKIRFNRVSIRMGITIF